MMTWRLGLGVAFLFSVGCGSALRQPAIPQDAWTPTMSEPSQPASATGANTAAPETTASRLEELDAMYGRGLLTEGEYRKKRQQIIDDF